MPLQTFSKNNINSFPLLIISYGFKNVSTSESDILQLLKVHYFGILKLHHNTALTHHIRETFDSNENI